MVRINCKLLACLTTGLFLYVAFFSRTNENDIMEFKDLNDDIKLREFIRYNFYVGTWNEKSVRKIKFYS